MTEGKTLIRGQVARHLGDVPLDELIHFPEIAVLCREVLDVLWISKTTKGNNVVVSAAHANALLVLCVLYIVAELGVTAPRHGPTSSGLCRNNSMAFTLNSTQLLYFIFRAAGDSAKKQIASIQDENGFQKKALLWVRQKTRFLESC